MARHRSNRPKFNERQIFSAYARMAHEDYGQIVLWDLMQRFYERTSAPPDGNPNLTILNEGKRFVVLYIKSQVELGEAQLGASDGIVDAGDARIDIDGHPAERDFELFDNKS